MDLLSHARQGFQGVEADAALKEQALRYLSRWLAEPDFAASPALAGVADPARANGPACSTRLYQILPFGTGGRRGAVGVGPNRMNLWTLGASVQGHCEYLKERFL